MIFRQLNAAGDWTFGRGINNYATAEAAIGLNIKTRLLSWKGDCFFALNDFVDWIARLDKGQQNNLTTELKTVILQSYGVVAINSFTVTLNNVTRIYQATFNIQTIYSSSFQDTLILAAGLPVGSL